MGVIEVSWQTNYFLLSVLPAFLVDFLVNGEKNQRGLQIPAEI